MTYAGNKADLDVIFEVTNTGDEVLPVSIGAHPALNCPLLPEVGREAYSVTFLNEEREPSA